MCPFKKGIDMEECKIKNCAEEIYKNGLCEKHYQELIVEAGTSPAIRLVKKAENADKDLKTYVGIQLEAFSLRAARSAEKLVSSYRNFTKLDEKDTVEVYLRKEREVR